MDHADTVFPQPTEAAKVPGPVTAIELGDGKWFGGSRLYGKDLIKSVSAKLVDEGPVFARAEIAYDYADGAALKVIVQLVAGDNGMLVDMDVPQDRPEDGWEFLLNGGPAIKGGTARWWWNEWRDKTFEVAGVSTNPICHLGPWRAGWSSNTMGTSRSLPRHLYTC